MHAPQPIFEYQQERLEGRLAEDLVNNGFERTTHAKTNITI
ncbi:MAG: hypothetical protein ABGY43_21045 [bacterium]|jgi:hypothetical protein